ncbi:MAG: response regulator transcription factor [Synergistaceae bacterium]|nr:response regulator transcription factor [Synergistaceae bacterium]
MSKIMIVDDDDNIRELVCVLLRNNGFKVCEAVDGLDALKKIPAENPDLVIIDVMMPLMDGFELCEHLRQNYDDIPALMLTARGELNHKVRAFERGIDDYLTKPFEGSELVMRVRALLRRCKIESSQTAQAGDVTIDWSNRTVIVQGVRTYIPMKECELLFTLASFPGRAFSRNQLIENIWGTDFDGNERTLDVHISRLRERFPPEKYRFKITTIRGLGYRLEIIS